MGDPVRELSHDHADLNRRVREIGAMLASGSNRARLAVVLKELREHLFFHFAREEEGLFPFVSDRIPERAARVAAMAVAHDAICGSLARMVHVATAGLAAITAAAPTTADEVAASPGELAVLRALFERFQAAYADHARLEAELLQVLDDRLDTAQRAQLAELVRDL
ncbi:MAG TPA: hemerythrin domain-containing protein [Kofleriaceae bacterium]|nr:hemerythrin domain-containing protein [Kofleriaceae bacterium]